MQLPAFINGLELTESRETLHSTALTTPQLLAQFLRYLVNDFISPTPFVATLLAILLPLALLVATVLRLRARRPVGAGWLLAFVSATLLLLYVVSNEALRIVSEQRMRYLIALWPLLALLAGAGLRLLAGAHRRLAAAMLALWLIPGVTLVLTTDLRYELGYCHQRSIHRVYQVIREQIPASDFLIQDTRLAPSDTSLFYVRLMGADWTTLSRYRADPNESIRPVNVDYPYAWLLYLSKDRVGFADLPGALGRVFCERVLDEWGFTLERYALHSVENCPDKPVRLAFDSDIQLTAPKITLREGLLRLDAHIRSADEQRLARYSLALHVVAADSGERVAQSDLGVGPGAIVPLRSEVDIAALPPGEYEVRVALYDWQTGVRLPARDLETGAAGDMLALQRFRLG